MRIPNNARGPWLITLGLLLTPSAHAADKATSPAQKETPHDTPPLELLEFLGNFETPEGKWIDPRYFSGESHLAAEASPKEKSNHE